DERDGAADRRFGRDVADNHAVGSAGEPAVCNQPYSIAQPHADDGRSRDQHLAHAGAATRAFVANHHDIARTDAAREDGFVAIIFAVEDARRAGDLVMLDACDLGYTTFLSEVAFQ